MLMNNWYVAAKSHEVNAEKPLIVRMLGQNFVLYRTPENRAVCLTNTCCHRGGSIGRGELDGAGRIACGYHGWKFNPQGQCVEIPSLGKDAKIPKRARIDSYPVEEHFDWVWVFLGDLEEEERPAIPATEFPEYHDRENWRVVSMEFDADVNWARGHENSLDSAHPAFVHSSFGRRSAPKVQIVPLVENAFGGHNATRERVPPKRTQVSRDIARLVSEKRGNTVASTDSYLAGISHRIDITREGNIRQVTVSARTPVDPWNTRIFMHQARNYLMEEEHDEARREGIRLAFREDYEAVASVEPKFVPRTMAHQLLVESDQLETAFRKVLFEKIRQGWEIDFEKLQEDSRYRHYSIPSPARRNDPKNWVHPVVPTTSERQG